MNKTEFVGNLSTVIKILIITLAPTISIYIGTDENTVIALLTAIAGLLFSLVDAKFPNSFIGGENSNEEP